MALAVVTHGWLTVWKPAIGPAALAAFVISFAISRVSLELGVAIVAATAYVAPALLSVAFDAADYHHILVWLAAAAGPVLAQQPWSRWQLPRPWSIPVISWGLIVAMTWPIIAGREVDFSLVAARTMTTMQSAFMAPPPVAAAFIVVFAVTQMLGILWIDMLWARFASRLAAFRSFVVVPFIAGATLSALAAVYQALGDIEWMNRGIWSNLQRAGGLALDANTLGTGAAIWGPAAIVIAWQMRRSVWLAPVLVVLASGMWVSGSRTALVAFSAGAIAAAIAVLRRRGLWQPRLGPIAALVTIALFVLAMAVVPRNFVSSNPLQRAFSRVPRLNAEDMKRFADEMWVRFEYGRAAADIFVDHPFTGVGIGAFHVVAPDYMYRASGRIIPADNAQNWWRHQIAELGLLGAFPSLWFSGVVLTLFRRRDHTPADATVLRGIVVGVGLASLLGVPTQHPATWLSFATVLFWLAATVGVTPGASVRGTTSWMAAGIALAVAIGQAVTARADLRVPQRALDSRLPYSYGLSAVEGLSQYGDVRRVSDHAVWVTPIPHRWLQLTMWPPHGDVETNPVVARFAIDGRTLSHSFTSRAPVSYYIELPGDAFMLLEAWISRSVRRDLALEIATAWHRELPADTPPDRVLR